jgi:hypothetical protein
LNILFTPKQILMRVMNILFPPTFIVSTAIKSLAQHM